MNFTELLSIIPLNVRSILSTVLAIAYILLSLGTAIHILLYKDDIKSSIGWIALVFLSPFLGTIAYILFGINRVRRKAIRLRKRSPEINITPYQRIKELYSNPKNKQFVNFGRKVYPQEFTLKNTIKPLQNGTQAYPEMIKAIRAAKKEVLIESYIFDADNETDKFINAFKEAINNGAKIKVLVDGIGTLRFFRRTIEKSMKSIKGLEYAVFLPPHIPIALPFVNMRNHRKIMVIDGKIAFFGGMNLAEANVRVNDVKKGVLDMTFKIQGPIIDQISQVFETDWEFTTGKRFNSIPYCNIRNKNDCCMPARVIPAGPNTHNNEIELMVCGAINFASSKIVVVSPYFLPENNILTALEMAAMRGVNIEIIVPELSNHLIMRWAEKANFYRLTHKGIKIYRTPRPFDHSKLFIVDDSWVFVGSANWDVRSFKLHFEANIEVFSRDFAKEMAVIAEEKISKAKLVTLNDCQNISLLKRIRNNAFRLITPYY
jgi:cardiolipin synthase